MGVNISDMLEKKELSLPELSGKIVAVDAHLWLYQFLSTIWFQNNHPSSQLKTSLHKLLPYRSLFYAPLKTMNNYIIG